MLKINKEVNISLYSFDPNSNVNMDTFKEFWESRQFGWKHSNLAVVLNPKRNFYNLKCFSFLRSSIENVCKVIWYKTRKIFLDLKIKNKISNFEIEVETIDNLFTFNDHIDVFKIDVKL